MKLWLVRHAALRIDAGVCYGSLDLPPDPPATMAAARALSLALPQGLALRTSPLQRCEQLSQQLRGLRPDLALKTDDRLKEMDFGAWEGLRWDDIGHAAVQAWTRDFAQHRPGGGESVNGFMARVGQALAQARSEGIDCAWITHAGVIRAASLLAAGQSMVSRADQWPAEAVPPGSWKVLRL